MQIAQYLLHDPTTSWRGLQPLLFLSPSDLGHSRTWLRSSRHARLHNAASTMPGGSGGWPRPQACEFARACGRAGTCRERAAVWAPIMAAHSAVDTGQGPWEAEGKNQRNILKKHGLGPLPARMHVEGTPCFGATHVDALIAAPWGGGGGVQRTDHWSLTLWPIRPTCTNILPAHRPMIII